MDVCEEHEWESVLLKRVFDQGKVRVFHKLGKARLSESNARGFEESRPLLSSDEEEGENVFDGDVVHHDSLQVVLESREEK